MVRKLFLLSIALLGFSVINGCGSDAPATVVDGSDTSAIEEYEALIKAEEEKANAGMSDTE